MTELYGWPVDDERVDRVRTMHRSVSQVKTNCMHEYFLARIVQAWKRPAAWFPHGTAFHTTAEQFEKSCRTLSETDMLDVFTAAYDQDVQTYLDDTPNTKFWQYSGRYGGEEDIARRHGTGREQVLGYREYYLETAPEEVIWITPDGESAIELEFDVDLDGVQMKGFIDQVVMVREPVAKPRTKSGAVSKSRAAVAEYEAALAAAPMKPLVRDLKSGSLPGDTFQLKVYDVVLERQYGVTTGQGDYWMAKTGKPTGTYDLTEMTDEQVVEKVHEFDRKVKALEFDATPGEHCNRCSVAFACEFRAS